MDGSGVTEREHFDVLRDMDEIRARERFAIVVAFGYFAWTQIQRRLENLNHENERILAVTEKTVSQDTYLANENQRRAEQHELADWRKTVDEGRTQTVTRDEFERDTRGEARQERTDRRGAFTTAHGIIGLALVIVSIFISLYAVTHRSSSPSPSPASVVCTATYHPAPCPQP
jgi:hypothetical protein